MRFPILPDSGPEPADHSTLRYDRSVKRWVDGPIIDPTEVAAMQATLDDYQAGQDATDTAVASLVTSGPQTEAALASAHPTRAEFGGLLPTPLREPKQTTLGESSPWVADAIGGIFYGSRSGRIWASTDRGRTWTDVCAMPEPGTILGLRPTADGEVIAVMHAGVWKSAGWGGSVTWSRKTTSNGLAGPQPFGIDGDGTKFIMGEYGPGAGQAWIDSRYAYISTDAGDTWTRVYDSDVVTGMPGADSHIHGVCYDPWADTFYVSEGHGAGGGIYHSTDDGATWHLAPGMAIGQAGSASPTSITATDTGLVCGSDSDASQGIYGVARTADPMDQQLTWVWAWRPNRAGNNGWGAKGVRDPRTGVVYVAFKTQGTGVAPIIAGGTPAGADLVYEWPGAGFAQEDVFECMGVNDRGELLARAKVGGADYHLSGALGTPAAVTAPDAGGISGGYAVNATSVAVGVDATTSDRLRSVAVGVGARSHQDSVVVGESAVASASNATAIGRGAEAGSGAVAIGDGVVATQAQVTLVGSGASATGGSSVSVGNGAASGTSATAVGWRAVATGSQSVAVGRDSGGTSSQATAVGYSAKVTGSLSVAVGRNSSAGTGGTALGEGATAAVGADAVALGRGSTTTGSYQVAVGARHMEMGELATDPGPAAAGAARLYVKDDGAGRAGLYLRDDTGTRQVAFV